MALLQYDASPDLDRAVALERTNRLLIRTWDALEALDAEAGGAARKVLRYRGQLQGAFHMLGAALSANAHEQNGCVDRALEVNPTLRPEVPEEGWKGGEVGARILGDLALTRRLLGEAESPGLSILISTLRLRAEDAERVRDLARERGQTVRGLVTEAILRYLEQPDG